MKKLFVCFLGLFLMAGCGFNKETIRLSDYSTVSFKGTDGTGAIDTIQVDDDKLVEDYPDLEDIWESEYIYHISDEDSDKNGSLINGDEISVYFEIEDNEEVNKKNDIDKDVTFTVENLSDVIEANTPFTFDNLEITLSDKVSYTTVNNQFSEYNNKKVIKLPITLKNIGDSKNNLNMFYYEVYGPKEDSKLNTVSAYFSNDNKEIDFGSNILPGKTVKRNMYFLYEGNGTYTFFFDNYSEQIEAQITVKK